MKIKTQNVLIVAVSLVLLAVILLAVNLSTTLQADSGTIELSKGEALALMNAQTSLVMATSDRDEVVSALVAKYGVSMQTHTLDIANGRFVPLELEEVDENATP